MAKLVNDSVTPLEDGPDRAQQMIRYPDNWSATKETEPSNHGCVQANQSMLPLD